MSDELVNVTPEDLAPHRKALAELEARAAVSGLGAQEFSLMQSMQRTLQSIDSRAAAAQAGPPPVAPSTPAEVLAVGFLAHSNRGAAAPGYVPPRGIPSAAEARQVLNEHTGRRR